MKTFIIDGYNVIKQLPDFGIKTCKKGREILSSIIMTKKPHGSLKNKVIIVYDGAPDFKYKIHRHENIEILFSMGESADELIKRLIKNSPNPHNITLITDDRELKEFAQLNNTLTMPVSLFFRKAKIKLDKKRLEEKTGLSEEKTARINEELKKIWNI